jgi:hypothetical protein
MSRENVEVVKRATAAYLAHDNEAARALYDPDIEIQGGFDGNVVIVACPVYVSTTATGSVLLTSPV